MFKFIYLVLFCVVVFTQGIYSLDDRVAYFNNIFAGKNFTSVEIKEFDSYSIYEVVSQGDIKYIIFNTKWLPVVTQGYGGPLDLYILLSTDLVIADIALSEHSETPWYVDKVFEKNNFAKNFIGLKSGEDVEKVDAITRATYTTEAVIERCALALEFLRGMKQESGSTLLVPEFRINTLDVVAFAFLLISVFAAIFYKKINRTVVLTVGLFIALVLSVRIQLSVGILTSLSGTLSFVTLFVAFSLILSFFFGRFYCGFVCPFGIIQEFANLLFKKVPVKKKGLINNIATGVFRSKLFRVYIFYSVHIGYILFLVGAGFFFSNRQFLFAEILNYYMAFTGVYVILITLAIIAASIADSRFYCKFICPTGYIFTLLRNISPLKTKLPKSCIHCGACVKKCPTDAVITRQNRIVIDRNFCIDCKLCLKSCSKS